MPEVSIIIGARNAERHIGDCLRSIMSSTFSDFEIILVDDASDDNTCEIAESIAGRDGRLRIISNQKQAWLAASLNRAMKSASGDFFLRIDADDAVSRDRILRQVGLLKQFPKLGVTGSAVTKINDSGRVIGIVAPKCPSAVCKWTSIWRVPFFHPSVTMRRSVLEDNDLWYNEALQRSQDYDLWCRMLKLTTGYNSYEPDTFYRVHTRQISHTTASSHSRIHSNICIDHVEKTCNVKISFRDSELQYALFGSGPIAHMQRSEIVEQIELREYLSTCKAISDDRSGFGSLGFGYDLLLLCLRSGKCLDFKWLMKSKYRVKCLRLATPLLKDDLSFRIKRILRRPENLEFLN